LATPADVARCIVWLTLEGTFCVGETLHPNSGAVI
jgi:2-hydroxycyclohexanecarboxyl-CoA dehydrogenase